MNATHSKIVLQMLAAMAIAGPCLTAQAALPAGAVLEFDPGVPVYDSYGNPAGIASGSYFAMDFNGNQKFTDVEKTPIAMYDGVIIGVAQPATGSHAGPPDGSESPGIDAPWTFFGNTGMFQTLSPVLDYGDGTLDFSGLGVTWAGIPNIPLGQISPPTNPPDTLRATIVCSSTPCQLGDTYSLDYFGHVPYGDASGFGGIWVALHLEGTITPGTPRARVVVRVDGDTVKECASYDGTATGISADITLPAGDELASIHWTLDGNSIGTDVQLTPTIALGTHTLTAQIETVGGLTATDSETVVVQDTQAPLVSAALIDRQTGTAVTTVSKTSQLHVQATATDVCDANPTLTSAVVGLPVSDGAAVNVQVEQGWMRVDATQMNLSVTASDASGNTAGAVSNVTVGN